MTQEQFDNLKPGDRISLAAFRGFYAVARRDDASVKGHAPAAGGEGRSKGGSR